MYVAKNGQKYEKYDILKAVTREIGTMVIIATAYPCSIVMYGSVLMPSIQYIAHLHVSRHVLIDMSYMFCKRKL